MDKNEVNYPIYFRRSPKTPQNSCHVSTTGVGFRGPISRKMARDAFTANRWSRRITGGEIHLLVVPTLGLIIK